MLIKNIKNTVQNRAQELKKKFSEARTKPRSKRESLLMGFTTVVSIFGVTMLIPVLKAVAADLPNNPNNAPKPNQLCPAPAPHPTTSQDLVNAIAGAAATICGLAVSSGSFAIGMVCGAVVVFGILKMQGK